MTHNERSRISSRKNFWLGLVQMLPGTTGSFTTGVICGTAAIAAGISITGSAALALFGYAGTAQLVVVEMAVTGASVLVYAAAGLVVNMRYAMFSLSLSRYFPNLTWAQRFVGAFFLTDPAYAQSISRFTQHPDDPHKFAYYMGTTFSMGIGWFFGIAIGSALGTAVPKDWHVEFCVPLSFLAIVVVTVRDRPMKIAALVATIVSILAHDMPWRVGLLVASLAGIVAGCAAESRQDREKQAHD